MGSVLCGLLSSAGVEGDAKTAASECAKQNEPVSLSFTGILSDGGA